MVRGHYKFGICIIGTSRRFCQLRLEHQACAPTNTGILGREGAAPSSLALLAHIPQSGPLTTAKNKLQA